MNSSPVRCECCSGNMMHEGAYGNYRHFRCYGCGHERFFSDHGLVEASHYEEDSDYSSDLEVANSHKDLLMWSHMHAIRQIESWFKGAKPRILDVGCFNGFFVKEMLVRGYDASGIDFNRKALNYGRNYYQLEGHISERTLDELHALGERFDVITLFEVVEHLEDFTSIIRSASDLLKPRGLIILSAPNNNMIWRPVLDFPPHHLSRFTPASLRHLMDGMGFKVVSQVEQMSLFDLIRNYSGSLFREKSSTSMRGGEFRNSQRVNLLRALANKSKWIIYRLLSPFDAVLHALGVRYISQVLVVQKSS